MSIQHLLELRLLASFSSVVKSWSPLRSMCNYPSRNGVLLIPINIEKRVRLRQRKYSFCYFCLRIKPFFLSNEIGAPSVRPDSFYPREMLIMRSQIAVRQRKPKVNRKMTQEASSKRRANVPGTPRQNCAFWMSCHEELWQLHVCLTLKSNFFEISSHLG